MPVMNSKGDLFDERRKANRRQKNIEVNEDKRSGERRKKDINASTRKKAR